MPRYPFQREQPRGSVPSQVANGVLPEDVLRLPWALDPGVSWIDYRSWVEISLDAGMVLHKPLPSAAYEPDTLGQVALDDPEGDVFQPVSGELGVNLATNQRVVDVIQRMATSTYTFILKGFGLRAGYQIPIPKLIQVGRSVAVPGEVQRAYNVLVGNASGIPIWYAQWELHYMVAFLGTEAEAPVPFNPALHIRPDAELPDTVRLPWTQPDQRHAATATGGQPLPLPLEPVGNPDIQPGRRR